MIERGLILSSGAALHLEASFGRGSRPPRAVERLDEVDRRHIATVLERIARSGEASFLAVLKTFGDAPPVGMLSFPRPGVTLAVDFPNRGDSTLRLMRSLDDLVPDTGGALYPAKDARMPARLFRAGYPRVEEFSRYVDPRASSGFWRRVSA